MRKIAPWLSVWGGGRGALYTSIFGNSKPGKVARYPAGNPGPEGLVITVEFEMRARPPLEYCLLWQAVPRVLPELLSWDGQRAERVMQAMLKMMKLNRGQLKEAAK